MFEERRRQEHLWVLSAITFKLSADRSEVHNSGHFLPKASSGWSSTVIGQEKSNQSKLVGMPASHLLILYVYTSFLNDKHSPQLKGLPTKFSFTVLISILFLHAGTLAPESYNTEDYLRSESY